MSNNEKYAGKKANKPTCYLCGKEGHKKAQCYGNSQSGTRQTSNTNLVMAGVNDLVAREAGARDAIKEMRQEIDNLKYRKEDKVAADKRKEQAELARRKKCQESLDEFVNRFQDLEIDNEVDYHPRLTGYFVIFVYLCLCIFSAQSEDTELIMFFMGGGLLVYMFMLSIVVLVLVFIGLGWERWRKSWILWWLTHVPPFILPFTRWTYLSRRIEIIECDTSMDLDPDTRLNSISHIEMKNPEGRGRFQLVKRPVCRIYFFFWEIYRGTGWSCYNVSPLTGDYESTEEYNFSAGLLAELSTPAILGTDDDYEAFKHRCQYKMNAESTVGINKYLASVDNIYQGTFLLAAILWKRNRRAFRSTGF